MTAFLVIPSRFLVYGQATIPHEHSALFDADQVLSHSHGLGGRTVVAQC